MNQTTKMGVTIRSTNELDEVARNIELLHQIDREPLQDLLVVLRKIITKKRRMNSNGETNIERTS